MKKCYVTVGTGGRSRMFHQAISSTFKDTCDIFVAEIQTTIRKLLSVYPFLVLAALSAYAEPLLKEGAPSDVWVKSGTGIEIVDVAGQAFSEAFHVRVASVPQKAWDIQIETRLPGALSEGQQIELSCMLRDASGGRENAECKAGWVVLTRPGAQFLGSSSAVAGKDWKPFRFYIPVRKAYEAGTVALAIMFGTQVQELELAAIRMRTVTESEMAAGLAEERARQSAEVAKRPRISGLPPLPAGNTWKLTFQDEFDGTVVDESKWAITEGRRRDVLRSRKAVSLNGEGQLNMAILMEGTNILDSWVETKGKFFQAFGFWTARVKFQRSRGHWCAFWLMPATTNMKAGSAGREVDIMEQPWLTDEVNHAVHWDGYGPEHKSESIRSATPGITEGWHTYSLYWTPEEYVFYVDEGEVWRTRAGGVCQVPLYVLLTDEAEAKPASWGGDVREAKLPDFWKVDYVRVYQRVDQGGKPVWQGRP